MKKFIFAAVAALPIAAALIGAAPSAHAADTVYVRTQWGYRCLLTDYDQSEGAPLATCEIPSTGQDLASVGAGGDFNWSTGNIGGVGTDWSATDTPWSVAKAMTWLAAGMHAHRRWGEDPLGQHRPRHYRQPLWQRPAVLIAKAKT